MNIRPWHVAVFAVLLTAPTALPYVIAAVVIALVVLAFARFIYRSFPS